MKLWGTFVTHYFRIASSTWLQSWPDILYKNLTFKHDLFLRDRDPGLGCDTSFRCGDHLYIVIWKYPYSRQCYSPDMNYTNTCIWPLTSVWPPPLRSGNKSVMRHSIFMWRTFVCSYLKILHAWQSCSLDTIMWRRTYIQKYGHTSTIKPRWN